MPPLFNPRGLPMFDPRPPVASARVADLAAPLCRLAAELLDFARLKTGMALALTLLGAVCEGFGLVLVIPLVAGLLDDRGARSGPLAAITRRWLELLPAGSVGWRMAVTLATIGLVLIGRGVVLALRDRSLAGLQHGFVEALRLRLIDRIAGSAWCDIAVLERARVVDVLGAEVPQIGVAVHFLLLGVVALVMLATNLAIAMVVSPGLAALVLGSILPMVGLAGRHLPRMHRLGETVVADHHLLTEQSMRFLDGLKLATAQNLQADFVADFRESSDAALATRMAFLSLQATTQQAATTLAALAGLAIIAIGLLAWHLDAARLIVLILVLSRASGPAAQLLQCVQNIANSLPSFAATRKLEADIGCPVAPPVAVSLPVAHRAAVVVSLENVTYRHVGGNGAAAGIRNACVTIPAGCLVGIAGPSGSGKTTLVDLVAGLLWPQNGIVCVYGLPLRPENRAAHADRLAYAGHHPFLFSGTLRRNLAWGASDASEPAMWQALDLVGIGDHMRRRGGLDAPIRARGSEFSAGERQRIALARIWLRRPALIILDEATASLDLDSEQAVIAALTARPDRPTMLVVSHRPETIRACDRAIRCRDGEIVDADV